MKSRSIVIALLSAVQMASAQSGYKAPRTADGTPDLQGIWQVKNTSAAFDLQTHAASKGVPAGKSVPVKTFATSPWLALNSKFVCVGYVIAPRAVYTIG